MKSKKAVKNYLVLILVILGFLFIGQPLLAQNAALANRDSLFEKISIDELMEIKKFYDRKAEKLHKEEEKSLVEGKKLGEGFLSDNALKIKDRDKIYIRISEYYIEEADREYDQANEKFDELFDVYEVEYEKFTNGEIPTEPELPEAPVKDYTKAIQVYEKLLDEYPASDFADDALYSVAWLKNKMDEGPQSRRLFQEVIDKYPDSPFAPESYIQLAEYYFKPREDKNDDEQSILELRKAIQLYKKVLRYKNSRRYDEALYKLGWSYYKLSSHDPKYYNDAITYFVAVADDIHRAEILDPKQEISNPNVRDEAIEYIGISFTDEAYTATGVDKARRMIEKLGDKPYGVDIMRAIGQTYQQIDEQEKAIYAFSNLLDMYPDYKEAPLMQDFIAKAVYSGGDDIAAYNEREKLYKLYNPQANWYSNLENSDDLDKVTYLNAAYKNSEEAFRTNLIYDLGKAQELKADGQPVEQHWLKFGQGCKDYLAIFPSDSNAYDIHWNYALMLDKELSKFDEAFEEYLTVSNDYLETHHQHEAALYAVGVADTIVKIKYGGQDSSAISLADIAQLNPESLTQEETNLIQSYDNYVRLFPNGEYTPNFLASAGGIYYNHKKFGEAKVYFQTLVRRFPGAKEKSLAMRSIMDSYFALGKFKDSEIIAKRILSDENLPEEQREFASRRLAEAIFKNAEFLAEQGDFFSAANEFIRLYNEAPDDERYVEPALWNAGLNFEKARDWVRSNETFDLIATNFPKSKFAVDALNKMVDNYKELEQYSNAAQISERIFTSYPESPDIESKLYNSSYFYQKAGEWQEAIRVNNLYIAAYPALDYSVDLFFKNAELYLKLDNLAAANKIYDEFAQKYPNDDRVVTAFYERGNYFLNNSQTVAAKVEYNKAIAKSEQFKREGKESNPFIAGEAVHKLADIIHDEFVSVKLTQPQSNIEAQRQTLTGLLTELNTAYTKVLAFGSPRSFEATYNIARSYEEFADIYVEQEMDPNLDKNKKFVKKKQINEQSAALYENAVDRYKEVVDKIPVIAEKLNVDMFGTRDTTLATNDSLAAREVEADSTKDLAVKWYGKAKDKISKLLYAQASLTSENVENALNIEPPAGSNLLSAILYQNSVYTKVVAPAVDQTIKAHLRNINEAGDLGLSNKYVEESKRQILLTSNILGNEYEQLAVTALNQFDKNYSDYRELIEKEFGSKNAQGLDYYGVDNDANQMIDESANLSQLTIQAYSNTLQLAQENNIENDITRSTQERILRFSVEMGERMRVYSDSANSASMAYETLFDSTQNYNYDDGRIATETYYFNLSDNSLALLESAFDLKEQYVLKGTWANKLMMRLLELDPVRYSESIEKERFEITSDQSWLHSITDNPIVWIQADFDDSSWETVAVVPGTFNQFSGLGVDPLAIWAAKKEALDFAPAPVDSLADSLGTANPALGLVDSTTNLATDSLGTSLGLSDTTSTGMGIAETVSTPAADTLVFFRKSFSLNGKVVGGEIYVSADDDFRLYLNGEYLVDDEADDFSIVDTLDYYTFDRFVKSGSNIIAVDVLDKDLTGSGLKLYGYFELVPLDLNSTAETEQVHSSTFVDPKTLKEINTLRKNRIPLRNEGN
ncbi:MAG: tetratricopeptide repeat protein [Calditrichaeota bacterium]|nr:tetratricopeptide repeat protein [Calditrichota bacterium]